MAVLRYFLMVWTSSIFANAGFDLYVPLCFPPCSSDKYCREGKCVCISGNDHFGKCVDCASPRVYKACPSNCPRTCDDDPTTPIKCTKECDPSRYCACAEGYVEKSKTNSTCVMKQECQQCNAPKVYTECATSCPETCDNIGREARPCTLDCRFGVNCVCPNGYVELSDTDSTCVKKSACPTISVCQLPKDNGPCDAYIPRFYFNSTSGQCEKFNYGGCQGNANRFKSKKECEASCSVCKLEKDPGPCDAVIRQYFYNKRTGDCDEFLYGGCHGNANRFNFLSYCKQTCVEQCGFPKVHTGCATSCPETCDTIGQTEPRPCIAACRIGVKCVCPRGYVESSSTDSTCVKKSACPCQLPKDPGPCEALVRMFYFNAEIGKCQRFNYGGCQGNANRFKTRKECEATCSICKLDLDVISCRTSLRGYFYNKITGDCERLPLVGCSMNANRFSSLSKCRRTCADPCILKFCPIGATCKNGKCFDSCYPKICPLGSECRNGACVKRCGPGFCGRSGVCIHDKCLCLTPGFSADCTIY